MRLTIISGGQTGVDRAALDAALESGLSCGGWCPEGRQAEDGPIPKRYPLRVLSGAGYRDRTRANVADSDATLIVFFDEVEGGTALTLLDCLQLKKPFKLIDGDLVPPLQAAKAVTAFIRRHGPASLNVAGPRASKSPQAYAYTRRLLQTVFSQRIP